MSSRVITPAPYRGRYGRGQTSGMTEHTHPRDEDSACGVAHSPVAPASSSVPAERTLVAVFASPVAGYLLRYGADMGFRSLLLEPDEARAAGAAALGFPLITAIPDDLDDSTDVVLTDHPVRARRHPPRRAGDQGPLDRHHGQSAPRRAARGRADRTRRPTGENRPRAPADRDQHRLPDSPGDRRLHPGWPARRPERPPRRVRLLTRPPL